jgi:hypothetical protein
MSYVFRDSFTFTYWKIGHCTSKKRIGRTVPLVSERVMIHILELEEEEKGNDEEEFFFRNPREEYIHGLLSPAGVR